MKLLISICARGGSKGIPGKNIKEINGKHLIGYSIDTAKKISESLDAEVVISLSTDDDEIKNVALKYGLGTEYKRPLELASDTAGKIDVLKDLLKFEESKRGVQFDYLLDLDVTSPLRTVDDLKIAFEIIKSDKEAVNLFSVNPAARNPYFNMVEKKDNGYYGVIKQGNFKTRQSAPRVFDMNASFYFYKKIFFTQGYSSAITDKSLIYEMPHMCFDLDEKIDFEFMSFLLVNNKLGFQL